MAKRQWTKPQADAIAARGGSLLVSAAAGSGKTAVLVERAVGLLADTDCPVDADRLLIVTFSRAAAAEMKQRMGERLSEMIRENPGNAHLLRQQALLAGAQICTVDSFCLDLVRENFQDLSISPDFTIIDQQELSLLQQECVESCVEAYYEGEDSEILHQLVELLSAGRDDRQLFDTIQKIYGFGISHPFFEEWLEETLAMYDTALPVAQTVWGASLLEYARDSLEHCIQLVEIALDAILLDEKMQKAYEMPFRSDLTQLRRCLEQAQAGNWDGTVEALGAFVFEKLGPLRGEDSLKTRVKGARDQVKSIVKELSTKYLNATEAQFREDLEDLRPKIRLLFAMVQDFSRRLWEKKTEKKRLYFSDLEHLALELLVERGPDGRPRPTSKAVELSERYEHVMVDEYQDTNEVQDMLFSCISRQQKNLFMVGDVKQSIYGFRQAMPEIFMAKKAAFFPYGLGQYPAKLMLDTNFRSRREVTGAVNGVFGALMSERCGGVAYGGEERLTCGATYRDYDRCAPELLLLEATAGDDTAAMEATSIAEKIKELMGSGYQVEDRGEPRPLALKDICILMRSPKNRAELYVKELGRLGIAATAENGGGYLASREVAAVIAFLRALDNPLLDVELVAALLSPLFDFTADDIARIRLAARGKPLYTSLNQIMDDRDTVATDTAVKVEAFLQVFSRLRSQAAVLPADRLIMRVYEETGALAVYQAMEMGDIRRANLLLLMEYAADYHSMGYKQLGGFVGFLGRLMEREGDLAPAGGLEDGANAVRIMSIHRSKGLEFPVVFLADTAKAFNKVDLRQNTLLHARYGFACVRRDYESFKQYPTVPMQAIRLEARRSILSEEMRILYVALTRAREKLIITGVVKGNLQKKLSGLLCGVQGDQLPAYPVGECGCYLDWIMMSLVHQPSGEPLRQMAGEDPSALLTEETAWQIAAMDRSSREEEDTAGTETDEPPAAQVDTGFLEQLKTASNWAYPFENETVTPSKLSVSAVAKGELDQKYRFSARPKFLSHADLSPAERGNAMHKFMQFARYESARDDLEREIQRMGRESFLSVAECKSLRREQLREFFASMLAQRIFASSQVHRELKFTAECGHAMLGEFIKDIGEGKIVLQGVADCVFFENGGAVIVDYKTDRVASAQALRERYYAQLELYRGILSESLEVPIKECVLYSFHLSEEVKI